jgi:hypothetical protein
MPGCGAASGRSPRADENEEEHELEPVAHHQSAPLVEDHRWRQAMTTIEPKMPWSRLPVRVDWWKRVRVPSRRAPLETKLPADELAVPVDAENRDAVSAKLGLHPVKVHRD